MPSNSASVLALPAGSTTISLDLEPPTPPPPAYTLPLESLATAQRNATEGSWISRTTGDGDRRPSLESDNLRSVPFSKSDCPECSHTWVSTAHRGTNTHSTGARTRRNRMINFTTLFDSDPERVAAAHDLIERNRLLHLRAVRRADQRAARVPFRLHHVQHR